MMYNNWSRKVVGNKKRVISSLAIIAGIVTSVAWALNRKRRRKEQAGKAKPISGDGEQSRSMTTIPDILSLIPTWKLFVTPIEKESYQGAVLINVG